MPKKIKRKIKDQKPLTLEKLADYNEKILIPSLEEIFVTKDEFGNFKDEFGNFKDETQKNFDKIFQKLDTLLDEKTVREHQEEKQKKLWVIVLKALKDHRILTAKELGLIAKLEVF
jgi:hypothetical protein